MSLLFHSVAVALKQNLACGFKIAICCFLYIIRDFLNVGFLPINIHDEFDVICNTKTGNKNGPMLSIKTLYQPSLISKTFGVMTDNFKMYQVWKQQNFGDFWKTYVQNKHTFEKGSLSHAILSNLFTLNVRIFPQTVLYVFLCLLHKNSVSLVIFISLLILKLLCMFNPFSYDFKFPLIFTGFYSNIKILHVRLKI